MFKFGATSDKRSRVNSLSFSLFRGRLTNEREIFFLFPLTDSGHGRSD